MSRHAEDKRRYKEETIEHQKTKYKRINISDIPSKINGDSWHWLFTLESNRTIKTDTTHPTNHKTGLDLGTNWKEGIIYILMLRAIGRKTL
jgi:hypothetical protein